MSKNRDLACLISALLRHIGPKEGLNMDVHGWVDVDELIGHVNNRSTCVMTHERLERIVSNDNKGRFRFSEDGLRIKACQGHSIEWIEPELTMLEPPEFLYHGTTQEAWAMIRESGSILRMKRHAVHMQADPEKAWQSALRWRKPAVVLKIDAAHMHADGFGFGVSDNGVWCVERVPVEYVCEILTEE